MTIIVYGGLGIPNSYATVAEADAYFLERNVAQWAEATDVEKEAALINASDYIDIEFGHRILGRPILEDQSQVFPTTMFLDIPLGVKRAAFELAVYSLTGNLFVREKPSDNPLLVEEYKKIGPLEKRLIYKDFGVETVDIPAVKKIMRNFTGGVGSQGGVYR